MKHFIILYVLALLLHPASVLAQQKQYQVLQNVLLHSKNNAPESAKTYLSDRSYKLYDRIYQHNLLFLLPQTIQTEDIYRNNGYDYVAFRDPSQSKQSASVLAFTTSSTAPKLDLPETFQIAFGEDWVNRLNLLEQTYLISKQYYGAEKSAAIVRQMIGKP